MKKLHAHNKVAEKKLEEIALNIFVIFYECLYNIANFKSFYRMILKTYIFRYPSERSEQKDKTFKENCENKATNNQEL